MSDVEWDADDFEPAVGTVPVVSDKWEGEDEDDDIKDNWDDEDAEEKNEEQKGENEEVKVKKKKKKKTLEEIIKEKEEKKRKELEERKRQEEEEKKKLTAEEMIAEKLRQQKLQEEADLDIAKEVFGVNDTQPVGEIDGFEPLTKEDFEKFSGLLRDKITQFQRSTHYVTFLEMLYRDLAVGLDLEDIKRLSSCLNALYNEKNKAQKSAKGKKKGKGGKITLNVGKNDDLEDYSTAVYDDYDDFI